MSRWTQRIHVSSLDGLITCQWCKKPMLTAIIGSHLLRQMAKHHVVKHATIADGMRESAMLLEKLAIKVRLA